MTRCVCVVFREDLGDMRELRALSSSSSQHGGQVDAVTPQTTVE